MLLDLHNIWIKTILSSIKKLKHLRYHDFSHNEEIEMLPTLQEKTNVTTKKDDAKSHKKVDVSRCNKI